MTQVKEITEEARRLKIFRKAEGLDQELFCKPLTITRSVLSRYETGFLNIPLDFVKELHEVYNMSYQWFFSGKGNKKHIEEKGGLITDMKTLVTNQELLYEQMQSLKSEFLKLHREFHALKTTEKSI